MSLNVPEIISKEKYKKLTNKTLNAPDFQQYKSINITTLIISKKPGNTGISRDIRTEFTTDLLLSD